MEQPSHGAKPYRTIIWGCGTQYNMHLPLFRDMVDRGEIEVVAVYDRQFEFGTTLDCFPIVSYEELPHIEHDLLIACVYGAEKQVIANCIEIFGNRDKVVPVRLFDVPGITVDRYFQIKDARFSILSEICFGGFLSHRMCIEHLSPFKNLWLRGRDYFEVLRDLEHFMSVEPVFTGWYEEKNDDGTKTGVLNPILTLDGRVELICNHDSDPQAAIDKWNRRRVKVNYDNLLVTFLARDKKHEDMFYDIPLRGRRVCFSYYKSDRPETVYVPDESPVVQHTSLNRIVMHEGNLIDLYSLFYGPVRYRRS